MKNEKPIISNTEWGLVAGVGFMIDLGQWILIALLVGLAINEFIDAFVAMSLGLYLWIRGQLGMKQAIALIVGWLGEAGSDGVIPLWGLEVLYQMSLSRSDAILGQIPGGQMVGSALEKAR